MVTAAQFGTEIVAHGEAHPAMRAPVVPCVGTTVVVTPERELLAEKPTVIDVTRRELLASGYGMPAVDESVFGEAHFRIAARTPNPTSLRRRYRR